MLDFFGVRVKPEVIRSAISNNTIEKMRKKEKQSVTLHQAKSGDEGRFIRKGAVGGWREKLTDDHLRLIDTYAGDAFRRMGYPLAASVATARAQGSAQPLAG